MSAHPLRYRDPVHIPLFDIPRTVKTFGLYFEQHGDVLEELLTSVDRCLDRVLPPEKSSLVDQEGSTLERGPDGVLRVRRHPALEEARVALAELGLFRVFLPEDVGGFDLPLALYYLCVQQISAHDTSLALIFLVHGNAMYGIHRYGSEEQRRRYLPSLASGERLATVAFTEPLAGSDAGLIRTRARREGDGGQDHDRGEEAHRRKLSLSWYGSACALSACCSHRSSSSSGAPRRRIRTRREKKTPPPKRSCPIPPRG